jgi:hypothetical protein
MADVEREVVITGDPASRGATALAVIIAFILLLILLAYLFRGELLGTGGASDVKVNVESTN